MKAVKKTISPLLGIALVLTAAPCACERPDRPDGWHLASEIERSLHTPFFRDTVYDIRSFGAPSDGIADDASAINAAIARCSREGGGRVSIPAGDHFCKGSIFLKSHVNLHFEEGAKLHFSGQAEDFLPCVLTRWEGVELFNYSPMIYARGACDLAITGKGNIDGRGSLGISGWRKDDDPDQYALWEMGRLQTPVEERVFGAGHLLRPAMVELMDCCRILIEDVQLEDCTFWGWHLIACDQTTLRRIGVHSLGMNHDGLDPESCSNMLVEDCHFRTGDDGIAIKSGRDQDGWRMARPTERVVIRRCTFDGPANAICIGSEVSGGVRDIFIEDCHVAHAANAIYIKSNCDRGGYVEGIHVRNIEADSVALSLLRVDADYRSLGQRYPTPIREIDIRNVRARYAGRSGIRIEGVAMQPVENIRISDVSLEKTDEPVIVRQARDVSLHSVRINGQRFEGERFE